MELYELTALELAGQLRAGAVTQAEAIAAAVTGCRYDRASVLAALRAGGIDGAVYRISAEDMAGLLAD